MKTPDMATIQPYVEQLIDDRKARENLRAGAEKLRDAYERSQKRRVKVSKDRKLRRQVMAASALIGEGAKSLAEPAKPKRRWPKVLLVLVLGGIAAALATNEELRAQLGIGGGQGPEGPINEAEGPIT